MVHEKILQELGLLNQFMPRFPYEHLHQEL
jgi:hypothetical protein